jgi:hypothetical protein
MQHKLLLVAYSAHNNEHPHGLQQLYPSGSPQIYLSQCIQKMLLLCAAVESSTEKNRNINNLMGQKKGTHRSVFCHGEWDERDGFSEIIYYEWNFNVVLLLMMKI